MTPADAEDRVREIAAIAHDPERAHRREDELFREVLEYYAQQGCELARAALQAKGLKFPRWCA